jgi:hypothetical protein
LKLLKRSALRGSFLAGSRDKVIGFDYNLFKV